MPFQNRKRAVDLLQQNYSRQFMRQRHLSKGDRVLRCGSRGFTQAVRPSYSKDERQRITVLIISYKFGELLGGEFLAPRVHQD